MASLSMDEQHRADSRLERDLRDTARTLMLLTTRHRMQGTTTAAACSVLAASLTAEADRIVRVWD